MKIGNFEKWQSYKHPTSINVKSSKKGTALNKHVTFEILSKDYLKWYVFHKKLTLSCRWKILRSTNPETPKVWLFIKVSFFGQCTKMQLITSQNFNIQTCFNLFLWCFRLKGWFKGQIISRIHLSLPNAYNLMCFDRNCFSLQISFSTRWMCCLFLIVRIY